MTWYNLTMYKEIPEVSYPSREVIKAVPVTDNGEPLVDIIPTNRISLREGSKFLVPKLRRSVYEKLVQASELLPDGYNFQAMSAYIPMSLQQDVWNDKWKKVSKRYWYVWWGLPQKIKERLVRKYAAYPKKGAPHNTGGAVDVILVDKNKNLISVGGAFASADETAHTRYENISDEEKKNRSILYHVMIDVGFVNQPFEWWHYSYGDKTWAVLTDSKNAIYDGIEI